VETIENKISRNFTALKSMSIMVIVCAHFYRDIHILWVPAALGLFIFAYSSAYFTSLKYNGSYDLKRYFVNKIYRLGINLLFINLFLLVLFSVQGKGNIWNLKTLLSFFGLTGLLDWLRIHVDGPFGAGMWFLTLLLVFYTVYPLLNRFLRQKSLVYLFFLITIIILSWLNRNVIYGHALWLTLCGFIFGFVSARSGIRVSRGLSIIAIIAALGLIVFFNFAKSNNAYNFNLLLLLFCAFVLLVEYIRFPKIVHSLGLLLSKCTLEMYLIHTAIFIRLTHVDWIDVSLSLLCIISLSLVLAWISNFIRKHLIGDSVSAGKGNILFSVRKSE
jgi:surface polysaccharide O-acyltransferase-like enzyme